MLSPAQGGTLTIQKNVFLDILLLPLPVGQPEPAAPVLSIAANATKTGLETVIKDNATRGQFS